MMMLVIKWFYLFKIPYNLSAGPGIQSGDGYYRPPSNRCRFTIESTVARKWLNRDAFWAGLEVETKAIKQRL